MVVVAVVVAVGVVVAVVVVVGVAVVVAVVVGVGVGMSDRTQQARERAERLRFISAELPRSGRNWPWVCRTLESAANEMDALADRVAALETALRDMRDAALPVVISYENCKAWAEAVGDKWVGVPDVVFDRAELGAAVLGTA